jgi:protease-4
LTLPNHLPPPPPVARKPKSRGIGRVIFWIVFCIGVFFLLSAVGVYVLLQGLDLAAPTVSSGTTLTVNVSGTLPEDTLYDLGSTFFRVERLTFRDVLLAVQRAKDDSRIDNLLLDVRGAAFGWARAEELRTALVDFKSSGKPLKAYIEQASNIDYFIASAADSVYLHPQSVLDLRGIQAEVTFMRSTLEKLGIEAEFEQIGSYKNAPDVYTRTTMSDAHREATQSIVEDLYHRFVSNMAEARSMSEEDARAILDRGPYPAQEALDLGLVDGLNYRDEVESELSRSGRKFRPLTVGKYQVDPGDGMGLVGRPKLALVYGVGTIVVGESGDDPFAGRLMGSDTIAKAFKDVREDRSIKAVVFRIDSPGGSDVASDVIWREAFLTMEKKPVVVTMANVAASGGYWIATASNAIVAEPTTITGSIGIYAGKFNLSGLYEKIGFNKERVMMGESADFWSETRGFSEEERKRFRNVLEEGYRRFLEKVSAARSKETDEVDALGQGRVWTGAQALERGLVDEIGGLERAVAMAKERAGIPESRKVVLEVYPRKKSYFDMLLGQMVRSEPDLGAGVGFDPKRLLAQSPVLNMLLEGRPLALMPYSIELK